MSKPFVSIILPCYKEERHLLESIHELSKVAKGFDFTYEFIFVEDFSPDKTAIQLKRLESTLQHSKFIYHSHNKGRGASIKSGFNKAEGDIIGYIDVDLEVSPLYISDMVEALQTHDVAVGKRNYFYQLTFKSIFRNFLSKGYHVLSKRLLKYPYSDTEAGYKFFKKESVFPFFNQIENNHWFWDTEFMAKVYIHNLKVIEIPVEFIRNDKKQSTVKPIRDSFTYLRELFKNKKRLSKKNQ